MTWQRLSALISRWDGDVLIQSLKFHSDFIPDINCFLK
ncbi:hypothetical protein SynROS8604_01540 [Synechococcus sp. ROS8604]|nr:hypothetical protein SynROS8604_01540 [Synechococcus sp. ROS8604]